MIYGFSVNAQSIVGKWKMTAAKETVTDKATGKTQDLTAQMGDFTKMIEQIIEFHSDNTYILSSKMVDSKTGFTGSGTYNISGKQLQLKLNKTNAPALVDKKYSPESMTKLPDTMTIQSQAGNTLVLHYGVETTDNGKIFTMNIEDTFTKQ